MEKGIKSRRKILGVAFKLFATYSYPDVSYSLLEEATGISRGSMVYYFDNKEGIFRAVLDAFFYGPDSLAKIKQGQNKSLKLFYNLFIEKIKENISLLLITYLTSVRQGSTLSAAPHSSYLDLSKRWQPLRKKMEKSGRKWCVILWNPVSCAATSTSRQLQSCFRRSLWDSSICVQKIIPKEAWIICAIFMMPNMPSSKTDPRLFSHFRIAN